MYRWLFFLIPLFLLANDASEDLFLRRIVDFWQEGEYKLAKSQMEEFIALYPQSPYADILCAALGDLFAREKNWQKALQQYALIRSPEIQEKIFLNRMQALYELQWFATLAENCEEFLKQKKDQNVTYLLAIALYQQCLNASKEMETLQNLAEKAKPLFASLYEGPLSSEVSLAFAHVCCMVKDFPKAAEIYLKLASQNGEQKEEFLFQAALIQTEFDKALSMQTFETIGQMGQKRAKEAMYNQMVLSYEMGKHEQLIQKKELLAEIPPERIGSAHLFLGKSLLALKKYDGAIAELKEYIKTVSSSDVARSALLNLVEASYNCDDLSALDIAIARFSKSDPELPKIYFSRAQILKKNQQWDETKGQLQQILDQFPFFPQRAQVHFELVHLEHQAKIWAECYKHAREFLQEFPEHELSAFVWKYFISASLKIADKQQLVLDIKEFLTKNEKDSEKETLQFLLAKTFHELGDDQKALEELPKEETGNVLLLKAHIVKGEGFCDLAEKALQKGVDDENTVRLELFNAYLNLSQFEKGAEHLYAVFIKKGHVKPENLAWLSEFYLQKLEENETREIAERVSALLPVTDPRLGKVYLILERIDDAIALLKPMHDIDARFILAKCYEKKGMFEEAIALFDAIIAEMPTAHSKIAAESLLFSIKLKSKSEPSDGLIKNLQQLMAQKNFANEPVHLEGALLYFEIAKTDDREKNIALLNDLKKEFEKTDDLLSQDYHAARAKNKTKNEIYQKYIERFNTLISLERLNE